MLEMLQKHIMGGKGGGAMLCGRTVFHVVKRLAANCTHQLGAFPCRGGGQGKQGALTRVRQGQVRLQSKVRYSVQLNRTLSFGFWGECLAQG